MQLKRLVGVGLGFLALWPLAAHAGYSALYAFGDSLSDAGNLFLATGGAQPAPPYVAGHFSNGPTAVEDLSARLGLGPLRPSLAGGTDYAFGGAQTGAPLIPGTPGVPDIATQVGLFSARVGGVAPSSALYSVWIGSNDILSLIANGLVPATLTLSQALTEAQGAAQLEANAVAALAGIGAKSFLVPLVGDIGKTPRLLGAGAALSAAGTALAQAYNAALVADIGAFGAGLGIDVTFLDTFSFLDAAVADPAAFGFTDVTDACYAGPYTGGGSACAVPDQYLFWDSIHPTAAAHAELAAFAAAELPEPGTLAVLGFGVAGLWLCRRRASGRS